MAKFPIATARQELGIVPTGAVRANIDVRTGEGQVGAAIGQAALALYEKYDITVAQTQLSEFQRKSNEEINRLALSYDGNLDPETYRADYQKSLETIHSSMPKNRRAARGAQLWLNAKEPAWLVDVDRARVKRADDNWLAELFEKQALVGQTGQIGTFPSFIAEGVKAGRIDKSEAVKTLAATNKAAIIGQITNLYGAGNFTEARELTNQTKLITPRERESILNTIDAEESSLQTQSKLAIKQKDDAIGDGFLNLLINKLDPTKPQLTFGMINVSDLSFDAKEKWLTRLRTFDNYSEEELREAFTDKGEVLADIYDKIDNDTLTDELDTMVGKGLSPTTAEKIKKDIRVPYEKDTEQLFKRIFGWTPELGFGTKMGGLLYEKTLREWEAEVKAQDATGEDIIKIGRSIARPYFLEYLEDELGGGEDISRMIDLALGEQIEEESEIPEAEKPEEPEVKEPELGETRMDDKGQAWEYIGDNKWRKKK